MIGGLPSLPPGEGRGEGVTAHTPRVTRARTLRQDATPAEKVLWRALRSRALAGAKFRRQMPYGPFFLDFAESKQQVSIEVDGDTHAVGSGPARDARRDAWLVHDGWRVLRFTNREVLGNLDGVLQVIASALARPHPDLLPEGEGEKHPQTPGAA